MNSSQVNQTPTGQSRSQDREGCCISLRYLSMLTLVSFGLATASLILTIIPHEYLTLSREATRLIEDLKNADSLLRLSLAETNVVLTQQQQQLRKLQQHQRTSENQLEKLKASYEHLSQNPVPQGYIHIQLPGTLNPKSLWRALNWDDITSDYANNTLNARIWKRSSNIR